MMDGKSLGIGIILVLLFTGPITLTWSQEDDVPAFGGPGSTGAQLNEDSQESKPLLRLNFMDRALAPWFSFKNKVNRSIGLSFGLDYSVVLMGASDSYGAAQQGSAGGIFRFFTNWTFFGLDSGNTGSLVFKVESRHRLGFDTPPQMFGLLNLGYHGITAGPYGAYSDSTFGITNLYWSQRTLKGRLNFVVGVVDATDYIDIYALINPWTHFLNLAFLTSPTIPAPNQGLGFAVGAAASENIYIVAGLADANGNAQQAGFDTFFSNHEYFYHIELGWISSFERRYLDNVHITAWYADEKTVVDPVEAGWGISISAAYFIDDKWLPFLRGGFSSGGGALLEASVSTGVGYHFSESNDVAGIGFNLGSSSDSGKMDQFTSELFYRIQLSENLAITPDIQVVINPANNPDQSVIGIFGVRGRLSL